MDDLHIPYQGRIDVADAITAADLKRVSFAPALKPQSYSLLMPDQRVLDYWVVAARCRVTHDDLHFAEQLLGSRVRFGGFCELFWTALALDTRLTDAPLCGVAPLLQAGATAPYARRINGRIDMSLASGKPYWAPECLYLLVAPVPPPAQAPA